MAGHPLTCLLYCSLPTIESKWYIWSYAHRKGRKNVHKSRLRKLLTNWHPREQMNISKILSKHCSHNCSQWSTKWKTNLIEKKNYTGYCLKHHRKWSSYQEREPQDIVRNLSIHMWRTKEMLRGSVWRTPHSLAEMENNEYMCSIIICDEDLTHCPFLLFELKYE